MLKQYGILLMLMIFSFQLSAQKNIEKQNLLWTRYLLKFQVSEKWTPFFDVEERMFMFPFRQHQFIPNLGANYKIDKNFSLTGSLMYFEMVLPQDPNATERELFKEIRPQIALNFNHNIDKHWAFLSRFKWEWRYKNRPDESNYAFSNYRCRMRMGVQYKFNKQWNAQLLEEVHFNIGDDITRNVFDQNRLSAGLNYNLNSNFSFETGYLYWFQQQASGVDFYSRNIVFFAVKQNLKLY